jgi:hypothetical protein
MGPELTYSCSGMLCDLRVQFFRYLPISLSAAITSLGEKKLSNGNFGNEDEATIYALVFPLATRQTLRSLTGLVGAENNTPVGSLSVFLPSKYLTHASLAHLL